MHGPLNVKKVAEKIKTHFLCSEMFSKKSCRLWNNVEKYCRAEQATAHSHCMLVTWGYKCTIRIWNPLFFYCKNCWTKAPEWMLHVHFVFRCKVLSQNSEQNNGNKIQRIIEEKLVLTGLDGRSAEEINKQRKSETFCNIVSKNTSGKKKEILLS
jgi:hypothetical protein